ncbi:MAG: recombinase family protein [Parasutterella sp.]
MKFMKYFIRTSTKGSWSGMQESQAMTSARTLAAQAERLSHYGCQLVIKDLGSGLNCKKPGLKRLLRLLLLHRIGTLVLTHDDRLLRFGTELIYYIAHYMGTRVVILDEPEQQSFETELVKGRYYSDDCLLRPSLRKKIMEK